MRQTATFKDQRGYLLILAVVFILVIGVMGVIISYTYANRARLAVAQQNGLQAFYIAESGLEIATRLLVGTNLVSVQGLTCANLTGASSVTNAAVSNGTFTATAVGGALYSASTTLSGSITASSNSLTVASVTGMASHGRVRIDSEAIDYAFLSGTTLTGLNRGAGGTTAASHTTGAAVSESVCLVNVQAGIPSIASPQYQRQLEMAVEILGASDGWAVGARSGNTFVIARWNNPTANAWNSYSFTDVSNRQNLNAVSASSATNAWAVGDYKSPNFTIVGWNGSSWTAAPLSGACSAQHLNGVATVSTIEAWAVGARYHTGCASSGTTNWNFTILKWNGSAWSLLTSPDVPGPSSSSQNLNAIDMYDSTNSGTANYGFAVGNSGAILRYTGSAWVTSASGVSNNLFGVDIVSASEAWAVGASGRILKWNGGAWGPVSSPTSATLNAISMLDTNGDGAADVGWAVGASGTIIYYNGTSWATQTSSTTSALNGVGAFSSTSAAAVGVANVQWNGTSWSASADGNNYNGMCAITGAGSVIGSQVGAWQQIFR